MELRATPTASTLALIDTVEMIYARARRASPPTLAVEV